GKSPPLSGGGHDRRCHRSPPGRTRGRGEQRRPRRVERRGDGAPCSPWSPPPPRPAAPRGRGAPGGAPVRGGAPPRAPERGSRSGRRLDCRRGRQGGDPVRRVARRPPPGGEGPLDPRPPRTA